MDSVLWVKTDLTENHDTCPLFYPQHFSILKILRITEGFQFRSFSVLWDNKLSIKNRDIPPPLGIKFFDTRNFLKHVRVSLRFHLVLWDKTIFNGNWLYPPPLLCRKISENAETYWNIESFPYDFFRYRETTNFLWKIVFSPVGQNTSRDPKLTDTQKGLQRSDSVLWDKTYLTENHDTCPLFYPQHFLIL